MPNPNPSYYDLRDAACAAFPDVGRSAPSNVDIDIAGVQPSKAFGPIKVQGVEVQMIERAYLPLISDRSDPLYEVYVDGTATHRSNPQIRLPELRSVFADRTEDGVDFWCSCPQHKLHQKSSAGFRRARRTAVAIKPSGFEASSPPNLSRMPGYQADFFRGGIWTDGRIGSRMAISNPSRGLLKAAHFSGSTGVFL